MWCLLGTGLAFYVVFGIAPAVGNLVVSFTNYSGLPGSPTSFTGLTNYIDLFSTQSPGLVSSAVATVIFVVGVTLVQNTFAMLLAHRLQDESKSTTLLRVLVFIPIVLGVTVTGIVWLLLFDPFSSPAATVFGAIGVSSGFFGSNNVAMSLVIVVQVWENLGFSMLVFIGGLKAIPRSVYEAAALDGVTPWQRFRAITWPLLAPSVTVSVLFAVIGSLTTYNLIYILTDGANETNTFGMWAFNIAFGSGGQGGGTADLGFGAAVTVMLLAVAVLVAIPLVSLLRFRERRLLA
jgi:raffinose/stachyose/melibiose transport system permease protein